MGPLLCHVVLRRVQSFTHSFPTKRSFRSKDMGFGSLKGKMVFLVGSADICRILEWLESFGAKEQGLLRSLGILVDFWSV
jgi:hypothetical protein